MTCETESMPAGLDGNPDPIVTPARTALLDKLAIEIARRKQPDAPLLVAVDGIDGSGKSTLADELSKTLHTHGVDVVRSTIDSFHNPRATRARRGVDSPVGFYFDSHDLNAVRGRLLDPFRAGFGSYVTAVFDAPSDAPVHVDPAQVRASDVLIFDGIFAQRPELAQYWDLVVFLDGQQRVNLGRLQFVIDDLPSDPLQVVAHVLAWQQRIDRYASGMRYYLDMVDPKTNADVVVDNNDLAHPRIVKGLGDG